ncbi:PepSY-associated TM helix domain-containing protein [Methylovulum miyakonense]|uniref:PepSY-associated TM helix domain-containing protein n=1 Tax=Methylovulum miyakonense TaxID=645578 RepID=UPI00048F1DDF|nr:PepSY-associated TM helix domain-containing protein [Methylovulum miyakonense]
MNRTYTPDKTLLNSTSLPRLKVRRKLWLQVHLWLGLGLGLFLAIIGLTGSVLVFWHELDEAINPGLYQASNYSHLSRKSLDELIAAASLAAPKGWVSASLDALHENGNAVFGFYYPEPNLTPEQAESLTIALDPSTAEVVSRRVFYHAWNPLKNSLVGFFFKLHYALFLGEIGVTIVGIFAVLFFVSTMSGLILWWPLTGNWKRVLTIKRKASTERFNHDLHQTAGFYSLIVLLVLLISGLYFNLPNQFRWLVERFSPLTADAKANPQPAPPVTNAVLENALRKITQQNPQAEAQFYSFSPDPTMPFTVCFRNVPELRPYVLDSRCYQLNRNTGDVLAITDPAHGSVGDVVMQWQWPLHSGQAFGWTGRILVCIAGLICPLLFVTGVIRWLQKRWAKQHRLAVRL